MDLVQQLRDVRFEMAMRGYDCAAVDTFLAKLRADVAAVQEEHDAATARIAELEAGGDAQDSSETEGTLRRTLLLAQRLADETEAEAKAAAAEAVNAANAEAEQLRHEAQVESESMRRAAEEELAAARNEAEGLRETMHEQAARDRAEARLTVEGMLADAERTGMERVAEIEGVARQETAAMREPIREEVQQLEGVRSQLLGDIAELEAHLEAQRERVKNAVEALRVGMSGSIEDLERVADDDALLATQPAPAHSASTADDVAVAPEIEIVDRVVESAPSAPTAEEVEVRAASVAAEAVADAAPQHAVEADEDAAPAHVAEHAAEPAPEHAAVDAIVEDLGPATEPIPVIEATPEEADDEKTDAEETAEYGSSAEDAAFAALGGVADEEAPVEEVAEVVEAEAEPMPMATAADLEEAELVVLDAEDQALFGTEAGVDAEAAEVVELDDPGPEPAETTAEDQPTFVGRFAEILDELPVQPGG